MALRLKYGATTTWNMSDGSGPSVLNRLEGLGEEEWKLGVG
jgi:hypothetical protein